MKKRIAIVGVLLAVAVAVGAPLKFSRIAPSPSNQPPVTAVAASNAAGS